MEKNSDFIRNLTEARSQVNGTKVVFKIDQENNWLRCKSANETEHDAYQTCIVQKTVALLTDKEGYRITGFRRLGMHQHWQTFVESADEAYRIIHTWCVKREIPYFNDGVMACYN